MKYYYTKEPVNLLSPTPAPSKEIEILKMKMTLWIQTPILWAAVIIIYQMPV